MGSEAYHEAVELLSEETKNLHRGIVSLIEELEAIDWYQQRAEACTDQELRAVLLHNRNEEIEHAMMTLEWIRRRSPEFDEYIRTYLLASGPITEIEKQERARELAGQTIGGTAVAGSASRASLGASSLGIGSLRCAPSVSTSAESEEV